MASTVTSHLNILPDAPAMRWFSAPLDIDPVLGLALVMLVAVVVANALHRLLATGLVGSNLLLGQVPY